MTIEASLRRPQINPQDRGSTIPDSKPTKAANPQLLMTGGVVRPSFRFDDGDGLTDAFGNVYEGYGGAGGSSNTFRHNPPRTLDDEVDPSDDEDLLQFNGSREKWEPRTYTEAKLAKLGGTAPTNDQIIKFVAANSQFEPADLTAPLPAPFDESDFISGIIEVPQNRTYTFVQSLPYDIVITGNLISIETGSATVNFPSGTILAGNPVDITVSSVSIDAEFLDIQLNFTRTFTP